MCVDFANVSFNLPFLNTRFYRCLLVSLPEIHSFDVSGRELGSNYYKIYFSVAMAKSSARL